MTTPSLAENVVSQNQPLAADRRAKPRHRCMRECVVHIDGAAPGGDWPVMVYNVSAGGIGLALPFPIAAGTLLVIEPWLPRRRGKSFRARVVRSRLDDFVWFHGCAFDPGLTESQLNTWLVEPALLDPLPR